MSAPILDSSTALSAKAGLGASADDPFGKADEEAVHGALAKQSSAQPGSTPLGVMARWEKDLRQWSSGGKAAKIHALAKLIRSKDLERDPALRRWLLHGAWRGDALEWSTSAPGERAAARCLVGMGELARFTREELLANFASLVGRHWSSSAMLDAHRALGMELSPAEASTLLEQAEAVAPAQWLIERGACVEGGAQAKASPLNSACRRNSCALALLLISEGADPNSAGEDGMAPAMLAAYHGRLRLLRALGEAGADFERVDSMGRSVLDHAKRCRLGRFKEIEAWMIARGVAVAIAGAATDPSGADAGRSQARL